MLNREQKLADLFRSSPLEAYEAYKKTLSPWMQAYSEQGFFASEPSARAEITTLANAREAYISNHLAVMDQIKKGPQG